MRPKERKDSGQKDLFRARFDQIVDIAHPLTEQIKRELRRRSAVEPVIGHLTADHRMGRNQLAHAQGDAINAVLAAAGYNFRRLIAWLALLMAAICCAIALEIEEPNQPVTT